MNVNILPHKVLMGGNSDTHAQFKEFLAPLIETNVFGLDVENVDVYTLKSETHNFQAGNEKRFVIFFNGTQESTNTDPYLASGGAIIEDMQTSFDLFLPLAGLDVIITSKEGIPLAEYNKKSNELNVLFDVTKAFNDEAKHVIAFILREFHRLVVQPKQYEHSWKHTNNKQALTERFTKQVRGMKEREMRNDKRNLENYEREIREYTQYIKTNYDKLLKARNNIENAERTISEAETRLLKDLDSIAHFPRVVDLQIKDEKFHVFTDDIYCYHDKTGERYYIGKFRIEIDMNNTDVRFFNLNNRRKGYWSKEDNAPHVSNTGTACLGNVSATIAELCSRMEIYALVMVAIDFLENVNTEDVAGRKIINWDKVDVYGNIIPIEKQPCARCKEEIIEDALIEVYYREENDEGDYVAVDPHHVCPSCRSDYYWHDEELDVIVRDN